MLSLLFVVVVLDVIVVDTVVVAQVTFAMLVVIMLVGMIAHIVDGVLGFPALHVLELVLLSPEALSLKKVCPAKAHNSLR